MKRLKGFTLAEVLITLAIIGVVAAISIPSVISNSQQQEFKTGLRKAVSVLNSAITMNMALDGETPYDNHNLFDYLQRHMNVIKSTTDLRTYFYTISTDKSPQANAAFYTVDGMRFEFRSSSIDRSHALYENDKIKTCGKSLTSTLLKGQCIRRRNRTFLDKNNLVHKIMLGIPNKVRANLCFLSSRHCCQE